MPPLEVMNKLDRIQTPWVKKVLSRKDMIRRESRTGHGHRFLASQKYGGHLKEEWAALGVIQFAIEKEPIRPTTPAEYRKIIIEAISQTAYLRQMDNQRNATNILKVG